MKNDYILSIIVPIFNAENFLLEFFKSLSNQECINERVELLLIDNGSTDNSKDIIEEYIKMNQTFHIEYHYFDDVADSYAARNYGVRQSKGQILAFTDSDCVLEPNWIKNIIKFAKPGIIISGEVEIQVVDKENMWEIFDSFAHLNNKENASKGKVATANLVVIKDDFIKNGYFVERFSGGDHEWSLRAKKSGFSIVYEDQIKVFHPSRKSFTEILKKSRRMAFGFGLNHKKNNGNLIILMMIFILKVFNIRTNIRYMSQLRKRGVKISKIILFNLYFFNMRINQIISSYKGFTGLNARELGIK